MKDKVTLVTGASGGLGAFVTRAFLDAGATVIGTSPRIEQSSFSDGNFMTPINTEILPTNIASIGAELNWEPFEWGRRRDEIKQKEITLDQSQVQLKQTRSHVLLDVNNQFRKLSQSRAALDVAIAVREAAHEKLREISDKYKTEAVLLRDVLQQQASVASADHDYEEALLSFWSAKAQFEKALGEE